MPALLRKRAPVTIPDVHQSSPPLGDVHEHAAVSSVNTLALDGKRTLLDVHLPGSLSLLRGPSGAPRLPSLRPSLPFLFSWKLTCPRGLGFYPKGGSTLTLAADFQRLPGFIADARSARSCGTCPCERDPAELSQ
ncbi:hypothetical protein TREES_T100004904 [Tupaia chinensis]|uniref:Uncharacterized protein n=1 Tax=Tupaia chinensis TaxID=246437 RepID=L9LE88_TUPCH|nr:hypothetical protein TREES_T100004904 [Tupaia chinensis]